MADIRIVESDSKDEKNNKTPLKFSKKGKQKKKWSRKKTILTILAFILVVLGFFGYRVFGSLSKIFSDAGINVPGLLGDVNQLKGESDGRVNVLLLGVGDAGHAGQNLSDTIMIFSLDTKSKKIAMVSVPRDMYVNIPGYGYARINEAHSNGESRKAGGGPDKAKETIAQTFDIPVHYYARVDFSGLSKMVDAVGGVDVEVTETIDDPFYPDDGPYHISKGKHHLNGKEALKYSRSRKTTSDFDRARRQQQVILAVKDKVMSSSTIYNPKKVLDIMSVLGDHIKTDFQLAELKRMNELTKGVNNDQIIRKVIDNRDSGLLVSANIGGASVLQPASGNLKELRTYVKNVFNEVAGADGKDKTAPIVIVNSTGVTGTALKEKESLEAEGFTSITTESGEDKAKTVVYDYSGGSKKATAEYLATKLKSQVITQSDSSETGIKIVLGSDYVSE